ncbi:D-glycero-beta-D-manno-heptose 1-phosphate adenylyltransferase [Odoribacter lunatus]|uniref:D-glycero-beta-D-manno-heptose 1-phosphate adenylyltransferase n=1 Tax=Odoribacter lunatus TaxID=2941335 RepID=UPI00203D2AC6|nr:D-glycero-beta-D-manno-heptose 1-phosphate adenylyltransferase [Odoribacter lunatus]
MNYPAFIENKIIENREELKNILSVWRFKGEKVVFTNGCFDILHRGHAEYLAQAASLGSKLVVGLNTDSSVRRLKGETRPVNNQYARALLLSSLLFTDKIVFFEEDTPLELIRYIQPDVLVKGSDYKPEDIVGYDIVKSKGGEVITIDLTQGYSTTSILHKLK